MVQLPPAPSAAKATASAASALATASLTTTVGGYTYDWTALKAAIVADTEVASGYFIVGNASDPTYLLEFDKGSFGIARVTPLASASNRSEEHTSELQSLMRNPSAVFCLKQKVKPTNYIQQ